MPNPSNSYQPRSNYSPRGFAPRSFTKPTPPAPEKPKVLKPVRIDGDPNAWTVIQHKVDPNTGWTKTTCAMPAAGGLIINTCSRKKGMAVCSEAVCFVPGADLVTVGNVTSVK